VGSSHLVLCAVAQAHLLKYPRDVAPILVPGGAREDPQVVTARKDGVERGRFDNRADVRQDSRALALNVMAQDACAALCRANKAEQHTNGRGFACAVGAEEAKDGTGVNRQVQCIDGTVPAKLFGESCHFDGE